MYTTVRLPHFPVHPALRYPGAVMLWVESEAHILNNRLDARVDKMVEAGLIDEMLLFHDRYNEERIANEGQNFSPFSNEGQTFRS